MVKWQGQLGPIYIYIHLHTYIYIDTYTYTYIYIYTYLHTNLSYMILYQSTYVSCTFTWLAAAPSAPGFPWAFGHAGTMDGVLDPQVASRVSAVEAEIQQLKMQQLQEMFLFLEKKFSWVVGSPSKIPDYPLVN